MKATWTILTATILASCAALSTKEEHELKESDLWVRLDGELKNESTSILAWAFGEVKGDELCGEVASGEYEFDVEGSSFGLDVPKVCQGARLSLARIGIRRGEEVEVREFDDGSVSRETETREDRPTASPSD